MTEDESKYLFLTYEGPFHIEIISIFAKFLRENIFATEYAKKRLYKVFIELTQNVAHYSLNRLPLMKSPVTGIGKVYIVNLENEVKCITINKIQKEQAPVLVKNCSHINASTIPALRVKKRELHRMASLHDTGAHIGLIMIRIFSENNLDFEIIEDQNCIYFKIAATINKNEMSMIP